MSRRSRFGTVIYGPRRRLFEGRWDSRRSIFATLSLSRRSQAAWLFANHSPPMVISCAFLVNLIERALEEQRSISPESKSPTACFEDIRDYRKSFVRENLSGFLRLIKIFFFFFNLLLLLGKPIEQDTRITPAQVYNVYRVEKKCTVVIHQTEHSSAKVGQASYRHPAVS